MAGDFEGDRLVLVSDPSKMVWGLERLRFTFTPTGDGYELNGELWQIEGFVPYCAVVYVPVPIAVEAGRGENS